jgi:hypothetical protein
MLETKNVPKHLYLRNKKKKILLSDLVAATFLNLFA